MINWNFIGVLLWVIAILYLVFIVQNIRQRHLAMIIKKHQQFNWPNLLIDILEILILLVGVGYLFGKIMLDNPDLENTNEISSTITYQPLIINTGAGNSSYVTIDSKKKKIGTQTYTYYCAGNKTTVSSDFATVAYDKNPLDINAARIPYDEKELKKQDHKYQRAYVAVYTAKYKPVWQNGVGLHAGHIATRYYLIRIPDASFIKQKQLKTGN